MSRYECNFRKGKVGYLEITEPISDREKKYDFVPYRSKSHLRLAELVKANRRPIVLLESEKHSMEVVVLRMSPDSITVMKKKTAKESSLIKKIVNFFNE